MTGLLGFNGNFPRTEPNTYLDRSSKRQLSGDKLGVSSVVNYIISVALLVGLANFKPTIRRFMFKRKLTFKCKYATKNTESIFEAEYETETQVDQSSRKLGLVSDYIPVIVAVVVAFIKQVFNDF